MYSNFQNWLRAERVSPNKLIENLDKMDTKYILTFCTLATKLVLQSITTSKMYINAQDEKRCQYLLCEIKTNHVFFYLFYVIFMCSWHGRNQRDFSCGCA